MQRKYSDLVCRLALSLLAGLFLFAIGETRGQPPPIGFPAGTLTYGINQSLALRLDCYPDHIDFEPVALSPDQAVQINLQFATSAAGATILVGVESAGEITTPTNDGAVTIGNDGTVSIGFRAPHDPGQCPMRFRFGSALTLLPLWVMDPAQEQSPLRSQKAGGNKK